MSEKDEKGPSGNKGHDLFFCLCSVSEFVFYFLFSGLKVSHMRYLVSDFVMQGKEKKL